MRKKLKEHRFIILAIFLTTGVSLAGWAFTFHYDNKAKAAGLPKELKNDLQAMKVASSALDQSRTILLLVSAGLIGFFGVRRKRKTAKTIVTYNRLKIRFRINLLTEKNLESQTCRPGVSGCAAS